MNSTQKTIKKRLRKINYRKNKIIIKKIKNQKKKNPEKTKEV